MKASYNTTVRTHIIFPKDIISAVDKVVGKRRRSNFIATAAKEKLDRTKLIMTARKAAGALENKAIAGWETKKSTNIWVNKLRIENDKTIDTP